MVNSAILADMRLSLLRALRRYSDQVFFRQPIHLGELGSAARAGNRYGTRPFPKRAEAEDPAREYEKAHSSTFAKVAAEAKQGT